MSITIEKKLLRKKVSELKTQYSDSYLDDLSARIITRLESCDFFKEASKVFVYNSMQGEVSTTVFIQEWMKKKELYLPVIKTGNMVFRRYNSITPLKKSAYGIWEPEGNDFVDYNQADLIIVPGIAFDRTLNRMGRGKGYYDRFLRGMQALKVGVCFDFQLFDSVPSCEEDVKMDLIISEKEIIGQ